LLSVLVTLIKTIGTNRSSKVLCRVIKMHGRNATLLNS
jgi:hypothetical protein